MTAPTASRTLERNLNVLRVLDRDDLIEEIGQLPKRLQPAAAVAAVRYLAPARAAILDASDVEFPAVAYSLIAAAGAEGGHR